jgi:hypothetical protein
MVVQAHPNNHMLGETDTTLGAVRHGNYVAKISVAPLSENLKALAGKEMDVNEPGAYHDMVVDFFKTQGAKYELRAQLCTNLKTMPVEDASIDWPQNQPPVRCWTRWCCRPRMPTAQPAACMLMTCCPSTPFTVCPSTCRWVASRPANRAPSTDIR